MVSSDGGENHRAKRKTVMAELVKGKGIAVQLKTLIESGDRELGREDDVVLAKDLSLQMIRSFNRILSMVNSCGNRPAVDGGDRGKNKPEVVKHRRGCYKRRKSSESWVIESPTTQDGHAWRKYGQKVILNSQHPRCYYRCTHKSHGCKARKQVQIIKDDPVAYLVTYLNHHTCSTNNATRAPYGNPIADSSMTIISFQTKTCQHNETTSSKNDNYNSTNLEIKISSVVKVKEDVDDDRSNEGANISDDTNSSVLMDLWQGFGSDHKPEWGHDPMAIFESRFGHHQWGESTSLLQRYGYGDVDEVNQIGDIGMIYFDHELI